MMGIDRFDPADLTRLLLQLACLHCPLHSKMSIIFAWIGTTPIRLVRRDNQLGNSVNLDGSVARGVTEGGRSPTGGTFLATARTHIGVHAVW
ncbi:hypothetical protein Sinme_6961 (plasmid) [Sinorhizobium meliloti AK83]|nr:hypothetical protein Sinme_6961 [Sinorhizobium meliloti AK83]